MILINANTSKELKNGKDDISTSKRKFCVNNDLIRSNMRFDKERRTCLRRLCYVDLYSWPLTINLEIFAYEKVSAISKCDVTGAMHQIPVTLFSGT